MSRNFNEDFDLKNAVNQWFVNSVHVNQPFGYGLVVRKEDGTKVKELLPLNDQMKSFSLAPGRQIWHNSQPIKLGAGLGDGTYTMEFMYRIDKEGAWNSFRPVIKVMFKISGNTLTFDCRPDWLTANMMATKLDNDEKDSYAIVVNLKNTSTDKTFQRTLKLSRDNLARSGENVVVAVLLGPGEEKTYNLLYQPVDYTPQTLYMVTLEDGSPLCKAPVDVPGHSGDFNLEGTFNVTNDLKHLADKSYVLKTDDTYEVVYQYKNAGTGYFGGYVALVDSVKDVTDGFYEKNVLEGELVKLQPGETGELRSFINNDDNADIVHKIDFISYDDNDKPFSMDNTQEFTIRPVYDLSFKDFKVTPSEAVEDEYADYMINGKQATVSGKISNPEETAFSGLVMIRRYVTDFSEEIEPDEDGSYSIDCDKIYTKDVTIPAKGSIDYSQLFDMEGLVSDKDYSVLVDFEISVIPDNAGYEIPLYYSDSYLVNDATPTGISVMSDVRSKKEDFLYDLQGRKRTNGQKPKAKS